MDAEGNIISPLGCFKLATSSPPVSSPSSTSSTSCVITATSCTTMATTVVTSSCTAISAECVCGPLSSKISTFPLVHQSAPAVPQPLAAARGATTTTRCTTMVPTAVVTPAMTAALVQSPDFRSSGQIPAHGLTPCIVGGVRIPPNQKKVLKLISTLETALEDKDKATTKLIKKHEAAFHDRQRKYDALYAHCTALAQDLRRKEALLDYLKVADQTQKTLCTVQDGLR